METHFLDDLAAYKKSAAVMAAVQLGVFEMLLECKRIDYELCEQAGWNLEYSKMFLQYLTDIGYLEYTDEGWILSESLEKQMSSYKELKVIAQHEINLLQKWLQPGNITASIKSETGRRSFDIEGFTSQEKEIYYSIMYGKSLKLIGLKLFRKLQLNKPVSLLEYGRSNGTFQECFSGKYPNISFYQGGLDYKLNNEIYDVIVSINTVHYIDNKQLNEIFRKFYQSLNRGGILCISDLFYSRESEFNSTLMLDWLTHGGSHNITVDTVVQLLQQCSFHNIEVEYISNISTYMIIANKQDI
jgi:SAM-dependent methyltransferase